MKHCDVFRALGATLLLALGMAVTAQAIAANNNAIAPMTQQEKDDIQYLRDHTKAGAPYRLNLANPVHYRYVMSALKRSGQSLQQSPQLFRALQAARQVKAADVAAAPVLDVVADDNGQPQVQDLNFINILALQASPGTFMANGVSSVVDGTQKTMITMELYTVADNQVYSTAYGSQFAQGTYFQEPVTGTVSTTQTDKTTSAMGLFQYVPQGGNPNNVVSVVYRTEDTVDPTSACMLAPNYCVRGTDGNCEQPVQYQTTCTNNVPNTTPIKVCYYRGSQQECDYYNQAPNHPTNFVFPIQGNAQFANNVVSPVAGSVVITLLNPSNGGGCYLNLGGQTPPVPITADNWSASGQTVIWNYSAAAFPDPTQCLNYANPTNTILNMQAYVELQGGGGQLPGIGSFTFTSDRSQMGQPGIYIVPPIQIQQGCFASGTQIRLADGKRRYVDQFYADKSEIVKSTGGAARKVVSTTSGIEPKPMIRLKTERGHDLLVTHTHPIITPKGPVMADSLKVGDLVETEDGAVKLAAVTQERFTGKVYNLRLEAEETAPLEQSAVYANGILAGDIRGQTQLEQARQVKLNSDPAEVRKRLAPEWREDYDNYLKTHPQQ